MTGKDLLSLSDDDYLDSLKATKLQMRKIRQALSDLEDSPTGAIFAEPSAPVKPSAEDFSPSVALPTPALPSLYGLPASTAPAAEPSTAATGVPVTTQSPQASAAQGQALNFGIPPPLPQQPGPASYGQPGPMPPNAGAPAGYPGAPGMPPAQIPQYYPPPNYAPGVYNSQPQGCILS